jgi:hypothetical protein
MGEGCKNAEKQRFRLRMYPMAILIHTNFSSTGLYAQYLVRVLLAPIVKIQGSHPFGLT